MGKIVLASSSPRRADIMTKMKLDFEIIPSDYAEKHDRTDFSYNFVEHLAYNKAATVAKLLHKQRVDKLVIGADTIVVIDNKILTKPSDREDAISILKKLSGRTHFVVTAVAVIHSGSLNHQVKSETTYVTFNNLTTAQIEFYIDNFKPYDKAGAYGIQELPDNFINKVKGDISNVIGLPVRLVRELIE